MAGTAGAADTGGCVPFADAGRTVPYGFAGDEGRDQFKRWGTCTEPTPVPRNRRRQACRPTSDWETPRYSPFILPCTPSPAIGRCGPSRCPARGEHLRFSRLCQEISAESRQSLQAVASPSEQCDHLLVDQRHTDRHPSSSGRGWSESAWHSPQQPEFRRRGITSGLGYHRKPESRP